MNAKRFLEKSGFDDDSIRIHYPCPTRDTIGYAIGSKTVKNGDREETVIAVFVRGCAYKNEWYGNAVVMDWYDNFSNLHHHNFQTSSQEVFEGISSYITEMISEGKITTDSSSSNVNVLITGYSRGAAVANLTAARLLQNTTENNNGKVEIELPITLSKNNIYAYCFECPQNTKDSSFKDELYGGIFNIVNDKDIVPMVAPSNDGWNFRRYGTDCVLPSKVTCSYFTSKYYQPFVDESYSHGYEDVKLEDSLKKPDSSAVRNVVNYLVNNVGDAEDYAENLQQGLAEALEAYWAKDESALSRDGISEIFKVLLRVGKSPVVLAVEMAILAPKIDTAYESFNVHYADVCLTWMFVVDENDLKPKNLTQVNVSCIGNVTVKNPSGTIVAQFDNNEVVELDEDASLEYYVDDNGQMIIFVPADDSYDVEIGASEAGKMTCTLISEEDLIANRKGIKSYQDIDVEAGEEFSVNLPTFEESEDPSMKDGEGNEIEPTFELDEDEIEEYAISIIGSTNGVITGGGRMVKGECATASIVPAEGETFLGWYDEAGNLVSEKETYSFVVEKDVTLEAKIEGYCSLTASPIANQVYTGSAIKPEVIVFDANKLLEEGKDYTLSYKNNVKVNDATNSKTAPTVIITAKGNYSGTKKITFVIEPKELTSDDVTISNMLVKYTGKVQKKVPTVKWGSKTLTNKTDFALTYPDSTAGAYKEPGTYNVLITCKGNYTGEILTTLTVTEDVKMSSLTVSKIANQKYNDGKSIEPDVIVKDGKKVLTEGEHYTVSYADNTSIGTAKAIVTAIEGSGYAGETSVTFKIVGGNIKNAKVTNLAKSVTYMGEPVELTGSNAPVLTFNIGTETVTLVEGEDYEVTYSKNTKAGTATVKFSGINGYSGTLSKTFKIVAYDIESDPNKLIHAVVESTVAYVKGGTEAEAHLYFGEKELEAGTDYKLSYTNNEKVAASSAKKAPKVTFTGKNGFKGKKTLTFTIEAKNLNAVTVSAYDVVYNTNKNGFKSKVTVKDTNGATLKADKDYTIEGYKYTENTTVKVKKNDVERTAGSKIEATDIIPRGTILRVSIKGKGNYAGSECTADYKIVSSDIAKASASIKSYEYTGKEIIPDSSDYTVKSNKETLVFGEDYEVVSITDNINKGTATVLIRGKGNYGGTKKVTFEIKAKSFKWFWEK